MSDHEDWFLRWFVIEAEQKQVKVTATRWVDLVLDPGEPPRIFAPLRRQLQNRTILIEHFSNRVSVAEHMSALVKLAVYREHDAATPRAVRHARTPVLVILAYRQPSHIVNKLERKAAGIYHSNELDYYVIVTQELPEEPMFMPLRLAVRKWKTEADLQAIGEYLLANPELPIIELTQILEATVHPDRQSRTEAMLREIYERAVEKARQSDEVRELRATLDEERQRAAEERQRAVDEERQRAAVLVEQERQRVEQERQRVAELEALVRKLLAERDE